MAHFSQLCQKSENVHVFLPTAFWLWVTVVSPVIQLLLFIDPRGVIYSIGTSFLMRMQLQNFCIAHKLSFCIPPKLIYYLRSTQLRSRIVAYHLTADATIAHFFCIILHILVPNCTFHFTIYLYILCSHVIWSHTSGLLYNVYVYIAKMTIVYFGFDCDFDMSKSFEIILLICEFSHFKMQLLQM